MFSNFNILTPIQSFLNSLDLTYPDLVLLIIAVPIIFGAFLAVIAFKN